MTVLTCTSTGKSITLSKEIGQGGEGQVWQTNYSGYVAKIYNTSLKPELVQKLEVMIAFPPQEPNSHLNHISFAWAKSLLKDDKGNYVGFLMPAITNSRQLLDIYVPKQRKNLKLDVDWRFLHATALNIASIIQAIHTAGYVVGDIKPQNILVNSRALPTIIDTDSFQVRHPTTNKVYRCLVGSPGFTPPELLDIDCSTVDRTQVHDRFGLAVIIYHLLFGQTPFKPESNMAGEMPEENELIRRGFWANNLTQLTPITIPLNIVHPEVQKCFLRCFNDGHQYPNSRPTARDWVKALKTAVNELTVCGKIDTHYYSPTYGKCYWCDRATNLTVDIFPTIARPKPQPTPAASTSQATVSTANATQIQFPSNPSINQNNAKVAQSTVTQNQTKVQSNTSTNHSNFTTPNSNHTSTKNIPSSSNTNTSNANQSNANVTTSSNNGQNNSQGEFSIWLFILSLCLVIFTFIRYIPYSNIAVFWVMLVALFGICGSFRSQGYTIFYQLILTLFIPFTGVVNSFIYPQNFLHGWWLVFYLAGFLLCIGVCNYNTQNNTNNSNIWFSNILSLTNVFLNSLILYQYTQFEINWNLVLLVIWSFIVLLFGAIKAPFADTQKISIISRINLAVCLPMLGIINCIINPTSFLAGWWLVFLIGFNILFTSFIDTRSYASQVSLKSTLIKISQTLAIIFVIILLGYVYSTKIAPLQTSITQIFSPISNPSSLYPTQVFSTPDSLSPSPTQVFNTPDSPSPSPTQTFNIVDSPPSSILSPYPEKSPYKVIQNYYRNINSRQYETAWNTLSTELKDNTSYHPNGYDSYIRWWDKFRRIDIKKFDIISQVYREAIVDIDANYVKKSDGNLLDTKIRFFLVKNLNDFWLINKIQIISREKIKASKTSAEEFISEYYSLLNQRAYKTAWKKLTPIFQNKTGTYSDYVNWWNNVSRINIVQIKLIEQNNNAATIYAELQYVIKNENKVNSDESRFYLYWNNSQSHWQIAGKKAF